MILKKLPNEYGKLRVSDHQNHVFEIINRGVIDMGSVGAHAPMDFFKAMIGTQKTFLKFKKATTVKPQIKVPDYLAD